MNTTRLRRCTILIPSTIIGPIAQLFASHYYARRNITPPAAGPIDGGLRPAAIGDPARFAVSRF